MILLALLPLFCVVALAVRPLKTSEFEGYLREHATLHHFVKIYAPGCPHCTHLGPEFKALEAGYNQHRHRIDFLEVEPSEDAEWRTRWKVPGYPALLLLKPNQRRDGGYEAVYYEGRRVALEMAIFLQSETGKPANSLLGLVGSLKGRPDPILRLSPETIPKDTCLLLSVCSRFDINCRILEQRWEKVGSVFETEDGVAVGWLDGDVHLEYSNGLGVKQYPSIFWVIDGRVKPFEGGDYRVEALVEAINEQCGTSRRADGGLKEGCGRDESLSSLLKDFFANESENHRSRILKSIQNTNYKEVLQKVLLFGDTWLEREEGRVRMLLASTWPSHHLCDHLQIRHSVLKHLLEVRK